MEDYLVTESDGAIPLDEILRRGVRNRPDVGALASREGDQLSVLIWHYHDDDVPGPDAAVNLRLENLPRKTGQVKITHYRIDQDHSNAFTAWKTMGSPQDPTPAQYARLEKAGQLATLGDPGNVAIKDTRAMVTMTLPRQGVSLLVINPVGR